jgi:hypothetical protein
MFSFMLFVAGSVWIGRLEVIELMAFGGSLFASRGFLSEAATDSLSHLLNYEKGIQPAEHKYSSICRNFARSLIRYCGTGTLRSVAALISGRSSCFR